MSLKLRGDGHDSLACVHNRDAQLAASSVCQESAHDDVTACNQNTLSHRLISRRSSVFLSSTLRV